MKKNTFNFQQEQNVVGNFTSVPLQLYHHPNILHDLPILPLYIKLNNSLFFVGPLTPFSTISVYTSLSFPIHLNLSKI